MFVYFVISGFRLNVIDGIRVCLSYLGSHAWALLVDNISEDLAGELLTLIVADNAYLHPLLVAEVLMIVHLTRDKSPWPTASSSRKSPAPPQMATRRMGRRSSSLVIAHATPNVCFTFSTKSLAGIGVDNVPITPLPHSTSPTRLASKNLTSSRPSFSAILKFTPP